LSSGWETTGAKLTETWLWMVEDLAGKADTFFGYGRMRLARREHVAPSRPSLHGFAQAGQVVRSVFRAFACSPGMS
jgi:hypothetical protein